MNDVLRWFAPPELAPVTLRRRAYALWLVSWPFFAVVTAMLSIAVLVETGTFVRRATTVAAVGALVTALHVISRRGRPLLASWMLVLGLSLIVTQRAWITGGVHAPVAVFYALFVVMAGTLLGTRGAVITAVACTCGAIVLTSAELLGELKVHPGAPPFGAFVFVLLAIGLALVLHSLVSFRTHIRDREADGVRMLVHDMRSPIQVMMASLSVLRDETGGERTDLLDDALAGAERLQQMTRSMLDVSGLESGAISVRKVATDLSALAHAVVNSLRILEPGRYLSVHAARPVVCDCDPELMRRVLENLVMNAMKHTAAADQVRVAVREDVAHIWISVEDTGPGIPAERRLKLFAPRRASDAPAPAPRDSYGLGLAFCRLAVEAHGGTIRVAGRRGAGTAFLVELAR